MKKTKIMLLFLAGTVLVIMMIYIMQKNESMESVSLETLALENELYYTKLRTDFEMDRAEEVLINSMVQPYVQETAVYTSYSEDNKTYSTLIDLYFNDDSILQGKNYVFVTLDKDFYWTSEQSNISLWALKEGGKEYMKVKELASVGGFTKCQIFVSELQDVSFPIHIQFYFEGSWKNGEQVKDITYQYGVE